MRHIVFYAAAVLALGGGCASPLAPATLAALRAELQAPQAVADGDCIFSAPIPGDYIAYRLFGLCLFSATRLRLYYGGEKPVLAYDWPIAAIKSWALHGDTFTVATDAGNFGLVLKERAAFIAVLRAQGIP